MVVTLGGRWGPLGETVGWRIQKAAAASPNAIAHSRPRPLPASRVGSSTPVWTVWRPWHLPEPGDWKPTAGPSPASIPSPVGRLGDSGRAPWARGRGARALLSSNHRCWEFTRWRLIEQTFRSASGGIQGNRAGGQPARFPWARRSSSTGLWPRYAPARGARGCVLRLGAAARLCDQLEGALRDRGRLGSTGTGR